MTAQVTYHGATVKGFCIHNHGIDGAQYFPGHGLGPNSGYIDCATGCGNNFVEAFEDAVEQLAQSIHDWNFDDHDLELVMSDWVDNVEKERERDRVMDQLREHGQLEQEWEFTLTISGIGGSEEDALDQAIAKLKADAEYEYEGEMLDENVPEECELHYYVSIDVR